MRRPAATSFALAALVALAACGDHTASKRKSRRLPPDEAARVLVDRNWIDRWPKSESDKLHVFRFVPSMGGGVYQDRTLFAGSFELFTFKVKKDRLDIKLPHRRQRSRGSFTIERVDGPKPFDLKLTLSPSPRGPSVYYGRSVERKADWAWLDQPGASAEVAP